MNPEEVEKLVSQFSDAALNVLKVGTGQEGIVRYLRYEGFSRQEAVSLSYPLFNDARRRLRRTQLPKAVLAVCMVLLGVGLPIALFIMDLGFVIFSVVPIALGVLLWWSVITPEPLPEDFDPSQLED